MVKLEDIMLQVMWFCFSSTVKTFTVMVLKFQKITFIKAVDGWLIGHSSSPALPRVMGFITDILIKMYTLNAL